MVQHLTAGQWTMVRQKYETDPRPRLPILAPPDEAVELLPVWHHL